jgi:1,4-dihydroxy-2-naphthoate octaprenyltransferase
VRDTLHTLLRSTRPPFLLLTLVCIFLGYAAAVQTGGHIDYAQLWLVIIGGTAAHISVNALNEYLDFRSGLDALTRKTPFSGGSGALVENPQAASAVLYLALVALSAVICIGGYLCYRHGLQLLPLGLLGIVIILAYTPWLNRQPLLCLIAPGTAFGPLMVVGTYIVLTGAYARFPIYLSLVPFFLVNNLLLLNQIPDIAADRSVGRHHVPIAYGVHTALRIYALFAVAACATIIAGIVTRELTTLAWISLVPMLAAGAALRGATKYAAAADRLTPYLALNVLAALLTPTLLGLALVLGRS